jgi:hypothetical protein
MTVISVITGVERDRQNLPLQNNDDMLPDQFFNAHKSGFQQVYLGESTESYIRTSAFLFLCDGNSAQPIYSYHASEKTELTKHKFPIRDVSKF